MATQEVGVDVVIKGLGQFRSGLAQMAKDTDQFNQTMVRLQKSSQALQQQLNKQADAAAKGSNFDVATNAVNGLKNAMAGLGNTAQSAAGGLSAFGVAVAAGIGAIVGNLIADGISAAASGILDFGRNAVQAASDMQKMTIALDTLAARELVTTGQAKNLTEAYKSSAPIAEDLMNKVRDLSLVSPFEYKDVINTFRLNMAFGATSDTALQLTGGILDMASAMGLGGDMLERIAYNFGQMNQTGKITMADVRDLALAGLDLRGVLKDQLGLSIDQVNAKLAAGSLTMKDVSAAFVQYTKKNFGGAAERLSRTFSGLQSSINDLFFFAGAELLTPALEKATVFLGGLYDKANELMQAGFFKKLGAQIGDFATAAIKKFEEFTGNVQFLLDVFNKQGAGQFVKTLLGLVLPPEVLKSWDIKGIGKTIDDFIKNLDTLRVTAGFLFEVLTKQGLDQFVKTLIGLVMPPEAQKSWNDFYVQVKDIATGIVDFVKEKFGQIADFINSKEVQAAFENIKIVALDNLQKIVDYIGSGQLQKDWQSLTDSINSSIDTVKRKWEETPLDEWAKTAIDNITKYIETSKIPEAVQQIMDNVGSIFSDTFDPKGGITKTFSDAWKEIEKVIGNAVIQQTLMQIATVFTAVVGTILLATGIISATLKLLQGDWDGAWKTMGDTLVSFFDLAAGLVGGDWESFKTTWAYNFEQLSFIAQYYWGQITKAFNDWWATFSGSWSYNFSQISVIFSSWWTSFSSTWSYNFTQLGVIIQTWFTTQTTNFQTWFNQIITDVQNWFTNLGSFFQTGFVNIGTTISTETGNIYTQFTTWLQSVIDAAAAKVGEMQTAGANLIKGFTDGVQSAVQGMVDAVVQGINQAIDAAKSALQEHSPSKVFHGIGMYAMVGFADGVEATTQQAVNAVGFAMQKATSSAFDAMQQDLLTQGASATGSIGSGMFFNNSPVASDGLGTMKSTVGPPTVRAQAAPVAARPVMRQNPVVQFNNTNINNGMDLATVSEHIRRTVAEAI